jgi:hypothetical protein
MVSRVTLSAMELCTDSYLRNARINLIAPPL